MEVATDSLDSAKPDASLEAEEEEAKREEEVSQLNQDLAAIAADSDEVPPPAAAPTSTRTKKKKKFRTLSLSEFQRQNEPSSPPTDERLPPPADPRHCSPGCGSFNDDDSLSSRWPPRRAFLESENEEMRSDGCKCNRATAIRPTGYERSERSSLAESQASKNPDPGSWSIWGNSKSSYYSPILHPPDTPPWVIMKMDSPVSVENPIGLNPIRDVETETNGRDDPSDTSKSGGFDLLSWNPDPGPSILDGGESSWPSLPGTNLKGPVILEGSPWKKGNGGQSKPESKENAEQVEEESTEEAKELGSTQEEAKEESTEEAKEESTKEAKEGSIEEEEAKEESTEEEAKEESTEEEAKEESTEEKAKEESTEEEEAKEESKDRN